MSTIKKLFGLLSMLPNEGDDESEGESGDCYRDEDTPILEKIGQGVVDFLNGIADKLDDFAAKL